MNEALTGFFEFFRRVWLSALPMQLGRAILVAGLFEALVFIASGRLRRALGPALARDVGADNAQRMQRHRIVLGLPTTLLRALLYVVALLIILRIFRFKAENDLYPVLLGVLVLVAIAARGALRDIASGYYIHYDYLYAVGDEITVGGNSGMVSEIGLRLTKLRTRDGQEIVIPNSEVRALVNRTGPGRRASERAPGPGSQL